MSVYNSDKADRIGDAAGRPRSFLHTRKTMKTRIAFLLALAAVGRLHSQQTLPTPSVSDDSAAKIRASLAPLPFFSRPMVLLEDPIPAARIVASADALDSQYTTQIQSADKRAHGLHNSNFIHKAVVLVGGAVGGGLAGVFGLQAASTSTDNPHNAGRNAAYAGGVAALFTLADKIWSTASAEGEEQSCIDIAAQFNKFKNELLSWRNKAGQAAFQASFSEVYDSFTSSVNSTVNNAKCRYRLKEQVTTQHTQMRERLMAR